MKDCKPTKHLPGSLEKIEVLLFRFKEKQELWHKEDQKITSEIQEDINIIMYCLASEYPNKPVDLLRKNALSRAKILNDKRETIELNQTQTQTQTQTPTGF